MRQFNIQSTSDPQFMAQVLDKIDNLTKPKGSLGRLESLAAQVCMIQHTLSPELRNPSNILFAADYCCCKRCGIDSGMCFRNRCSGIESFR